jgi:hypothetical protein
MHKIITESLSVEGKFPLTLVVMDEVQQYIGESSEKSILVQEMVEDCSKSFKGKLLFVATGQTAITGTSFLKKLEGRFTVRVELSDADVDSVIRKVILSKKPEVIAPLEELLNKHQGEISRHLGNTAISHKLDDNSKFYMDYPILPVRRKFWEIALRNLDVTGTDSQLRNQLSMIHKAVKTNLDKPLGNLIPTEYLYFEAADKMLQSNNLPRRVFEKSVILSKGSEEDQILASAIAIIFLIGKINHNPTYAKELGIRATQDTIVDLMLRDLQANSSALRSKLPSLLEAEGEVIMKVGDEYRIQTEESTAWSDEFNNQRSVLANEIHRIDDERNDRLKRKFNEAVKLSGFVQGDSKESREIAIQFEGNLSRESHSKLLVWVRNGWVSEETSVVVDARKMGNESPIVMVFVPKRNADEIRKQVMDFKAAQSTLDKRGNPESAEGKEARSAMETTKSNAEARLDEFLRDCLSGAKAFQAGGNEVLEHSSLVENIKFALEKSLLRLYPEFEKGDNPRWTEVYNLAIKGSVDALKKLPFDGDVQNQEVCKKFSHSLVGGKRARRFDLISNSLPLVGHRTQLMEPFWF